MNSERKFEVIIIGGSFAGLSAGMALGRSLRKVLIIDSKNPCNKSTPHSHNLITQDGEKPLEILQKARKQVMAYNTIQFLEDLVTRVKTHGNDFKIDTKLGQSFIAKKIILATGLKDLMPKIENFGSCWGISAIHCPYCHGYEFKNMKTAILANGEKAIHLAGLVNNLTKNLTVFTQGRPDFSDEELMKLKRNKIKVNELPITEFVHENGYIKRIILENGKMEEFSVVYAPLPFIQNSEIFEQLGCSLDEMGLLQVNSFQKTNIDGVFACGDNSSKMRSISYSIATGNIAGAIVNMELVHEEF